MMGIKNNLDKKSDCPVDIILKKAKSAKIGLSLLDENIKNKNLQALADGIKADIFNIIKANELDIKLAEQNNLSSALIDRLLLNSNLIKAMVEAIEDIIKLPDPIGDVIDSFEHKNKIQIQKVRVPIGVITVIYESRPNVTSDVAALCLKAGNGVILRGGKEAINTNIAIYNAMMAGVDLLPEGIRLPDGAIQFLHDTDRSLVKKLVQSDNIRDYGSNHSDAIIAEDKNTQLLFAKQVDSACVYINASTRFTDGGEFGMGAEIGISTNKLHARGPMGLQELTTYHYVLTGDGQVRA